MFEGNIAELEDLTLFIFINFRLRFWFLVFIIWKIKAH